MPVRSPESLFEQGKQQLAENHPKYARSLFRKALKEGKRSLEPGARAELLKALAKLDRDLGFIEDARVHYAMSAEIARTLNDPPGLAHTLRHVADILRGQKKLSEAEPIYAESLAIYRADPRTPPLHLANALRGSALLMEGLGRELDALRAWSEAKPLYEQTGVQEGVEESERRIAKLGHGKKAEN
jgi:tetratricopeptide (TPR) repeat protein